MLVGAEGDQIPAVGDPGGEHADLGGAQGHLAQEDDIVGGQHRCRDGRDIRRGEGVQAFCPEDLGRVGREGVGGGGHHQDGPAGPLGRRGLGGEGPGDTAGQAVPGAIGDAAPPAHDRGGVERARHQGTARGQGGGEGAGGIAHRGGERGAPRLERDRARRHAARAQRLAEGGGHRGPDGHPNHASGRTLAGHGGGGGVGRPRRERPGGGTRQGVPGKVFHAAGPARDGHGVQGSARQGTRRGEGGDEGTWGYSSPWRGPGCSRPGG